jgi:cystathionine gamma-lyase/cystathionine beta-lyase/cystathionine gamma-lyase/homocysteine desulfhydrase
VANYGVEFSYVDTSDLDAVKKAMRRNTRILWVETPTNPLMVLTDIKEVAKIAHAGGAELVVDNTFMSPYFQKPLALGADMVMHSTTKFLNGHSDGLGGVIAATKPIHAEKLAFMQKTSGAILSPFECWLVLRGVKSLAVRMEKHDANGREIAEYLRSHPKVKQVLYPGFSDHPQHALAKKQMTGFGSMITFETGSLSNAKKMLAKVRVCTLAESLGGVETLISHPATMTHAALGEKGRKQIGLTDGMVRISVGIEDVDDLLADLEQALAAI